MSGAGCSPTWVRSEEFEGSGYDLDGHVTRLDREYTRVELSHHHPDALRELLTGEDACVVPYRDSEGGSRLAIDDRVHIFLGPGSLDNSFFGDPRHFFAGPEAGGIGETPPYGLPSFQPDVLRSICMGIDGLPDGLRLDLAPYAGASVPAAVGAPHQLASCLGTGSECDDPGWGCESTDGLLELAGVETPCILREDGVCTLWGDAMCSSDARSVDLPVDLTCDPHACPTITNLDLELECVPVLREVHEGPVCSRVLDLDDDEDCELEGPCCVPEGHCMLGLDRETICAAWTRDYIANVTYGLDLEERSVGSTSCSQDTDCPDGGPCILTDIATRQGRCAASEPPERAHIRSMYQYLYLIHALFRDLDEETAPLLPPSGVLERLGVEAPHGTVLVPCEVSDGDDFAAGMASEPIGLVGDWIRDPEHSAYGFIDTEALLDEHGSIDNTVLDVL